MKNTKKKKSYRFLNVQNILKKTIRQTLLSIVDKYKENGYRDARIISDSIIYNDEKTISLNIKVEEGEKYKFGKITF